MLSLYEKMVEDRAFGEAVHLVIRTVMVGQSANVQNSPHQNIAPFDHDFMAGHTYQTANRPKPGGSTYGGSARRGSTYRSSARRSARRSARHSALKTLRTEALHMEALRTEALHDALH